jgi:hypothetical protein
MQNGKMPGCSLVQSWALQGHGSAERSERSSPPSLRDAISRGIEQSESRLCLTLSFKVRFGDARNMPLCYNSRLTPKQVAERNVLSLDNGQMDYGARMNPCVAPPASM